MTNHLDWVEICILLNLFYQSLNGMRGSVISRIMTAHSIGNNEQILEISYRGFGNEHIVLVHLPLLPYIRS